MHAGRIFYVPLPYGAQAATYYPLNTELWYMWLMLPLKSDLLVNLGQVPYWLACGAAVAGLARQAGVGRAGALLGGLLAMFIPGIVQQVTVPRVDVAFTAWFLAPMYFALRWGESRRAGHLLLFGISLGMLLGTKSLGVLYSLPVLLLFLFQVADRGKKIPADVLVAAGAAIAFGGFWYLRNWAATGNPFFPLQFEVGGWTVFKGAYGREAMQAFHSEDTMELKKIGLSFLNVWLLLYLTVSAAGAVLLGQFRLREIRGKLFMLSAPWMVIALFWFVNPHNNLTNGRFMFPAFAVLCYSVAVIVDRGREKWAWLWALLGVAAAIGSTLEGTIEGLFATDHLYRLIKDISMCAAGRGTELLAPAGPAAGLLISGFAALGFFGVFRNKKLLGGLLLLAVVVCLGAGTHRAWNYHNTNKYKWYSMFEEGQAWGVLDRQTAGQSVNIAVVGSERMYGLFGTGLKNNVFTVSVTAYPSLDFHRYWIEQGRPYSQNERPQLHRENADPVKWLKNLQARNTDILYISALDPIAAMHMYSTSDGFPIEAEWAESMYMDFKLKHISDKVKIYAVKRDGP